MRDYVNVKFHRVDDVKTKHLLDERYFRSLLVSDKWHTVSVCLAF